MFGEPATSGQTEGASMTPRVSVDLVRRLEALPQAAVVLDAEQRILAANQSFHQLLGYPEPLPFGLAFRDLLQTGDADQPGQMPATLDTPTTADVRLRTASGRILRVAVQFSRFTSDLTAPGAVLALLTDADADRRATADPARREVAAHASGPVAAHWELDLATGDMQVSPTWRSIWGFTADQHVDLDAALQRIHPADLGQTVSAVQGVIESGLSLCIRFRIIHPDGSIRCVESACRANPMRSGSTQQLDGVVLDITPHRAAEEALARYYDIVSTSPNRIAFLDTGCCLLAANAAFLDAIKQTREAAVGRPLLELLAADPLGEFIYQNLKSCLEEGHPVVGDIHERAPDGGIRESEARLFAHRDGQGQVSGIVVNILDVTSVRDAERRLLQSAAIYAATSDGIMITDAAGLIVAVNAAFTQMSGYAEAEILGRKPSLLNSEWHTKSFFIRMWRRLSKEGSWQGEVWNRRKNGEIDLQKLSLLRITDPRGKTANYVGIFAEPRHSGLSSPPTEHVAHADPLTKLPNRAVFESRLAYALDPVRCRDSRLTLVLLDLDHFAHINASLGHQIGDEVLRAIGLRLRETIRPADTLARLAGNQFGLLLDGIQRPQEAEEIGRRLRLALQDPVPARGHQVFVTASIGIALDVGAGHDADTLVAHAEAALHAVKQQGRDGFQIFVEQPGTAGTGQQRMVKLLRTGLANGEYELYFRPRVDLATGHWIGAQACVRWNQAELGLVAPERFLPLAESSGLMIELGQWVLAEACRRLQDWIGRGVPFQTIAVAISEQQLTRFNLVLALERMLSEAALPGHLLQLEFAESLLFKHPERVREVFGGLHRLGVGLVLTEVGSSWTAPAVLRRLPINRLMIHGPLIDAMLDSSEDLAVVQALIAMAQALDLGLSADGVRSDRQRLILLNSGCMEVQGELFSPPLSARHFERCLGRADEADAVQQREPNFEPEPE